LSELTAAQLAQLRAALDRREAELRDEVAAVERLAADASPANPQHQVEDAGEQGEHRTREAVRSAEQERDLDELRQIAAAKERMARGEYGECVDCGVEIAFERLEVQPAAARCIPCQERYEQTHDNVVRIPPLG